MSAIRPHGLAGSASRVRRLQRRQTRHSLPSRAGRSPRPLLESHLCFDGGSQADVSNPELLLPTVKPPPRRASSSSTVLSVLQSWPQGERPGPRASRLAPPRRWQLFICILNDLISPRSRRGGSPAEPAAKSARARCASGAFNRRHASLANPQPPSRRGSRSLLGPVRSLVYVLCVRIHKRQSQKFGWNLLGAPSSREAMACLCRETGVCMSPPYAGPLHRVPS